MVNNPVPDNIDLETFLKSAGQSFTDAQKALVPGLDVPVNMILSNAELELKVAVSSDVKGKMSIKPISSEDILHGSIDPGMISTIRITFVSSIGDIKVEPQSIPSSDTIIREEKVPLLTGLTLDAAIKLLKIGGWQFEPHAASKEEIAILKTNTGKVLRQQPAAGHSVDKSNTTISFWVDLGNIPVKEIDGIGIKIGDRLSKIGISSIGELSLADVTQVASALRVSESRARGFLDMAGLMSRLAILGFKDEVVELLVKGANISSIEQLASADSKLLYGVCREAAASGKVQVPRGYNFTSDDVKNWIKAASNYLGK